MKISTTSMVLVALGLALTGCGGGSGRYQGTSMPPASTVDSFTQTTQSVVTMTSDTAAPLNIDGYAVVTADFEVPVSVN